MSSPLPPYADPDAGLDDLVALAKDRYDIVFEPVSAGGVTLHIAQIANMRELLDKAIAQNALADAVHTLPLWAKVWPASLVLGHVLAALPGKNGSLLEVGAGCGVAGLVAAALGFAPVCISDINEDALLFARINVLKNGLQDSVTVRRIDVTAPQAEAEGPYGVIIASEILYLEPLYRPLVKFLKRRLAPAGQALFATDHRRKAKPFFKQAAKHFAIAERQIGVSSKEGGDSERHLLTIHRLTPLP